MVRFEILALAISKQNGAFDNPDSKAFFLKNPGLLKAYRPEKKVDTEHYRIFTTHMGGFKALVADLQAKCSGKNHRLTPDNSLKDMLSLFGFTTDPAVRPVVLFLKRALKDESISANTPLSWFTEEN